MFPRLMARRLPRGGFPDGIAFDRVGTLGRRLLVTATFGKRNALYAIDCRGRVGTLARRLPQLYRGHVIFSRPR